jgi:hypothetical protein
MASAAAGPENRCIGLKCANKLTDIYPGQKHIRYLLIQCGKKCADPESKLCASCKAAKAKINAGQKVETAHGEEGGPLYPWSHGVRIKSNGTYEGSNWHEKAMAANMARMEKEAATESKKAETAAKKAETAAKKAATAAKKEATEAKKAAAAAGGAGAKAAAAAAVVSANSAAVAAAEAEKAANIIRMEGKKLMGLSPKTRKYRRAMLEEIYKHGVAMRATQKAASKAKKEAELAEAAAKKAAEAKEKAEEAKEKSEKKAASARKTAKAMNAKKSASNTRKSRAIYKPASRAGMVNAGTQYSPSNFTSNLSPASPKAAAAAAAMSAYVSPVSSMSSGSSRSTSTASSRKSSSPKAAAAAGGAGAKAESPASNGNWGTLLEGVGEEEEAEEEALY